MASKYAPLQAFLRNLPATERVAVLAFSEIEGIIGAPLPPSAHEYRQWWENEKEGNHVNARAWASAGWKLETVDFDAKHTKFVRR